MVKVRPFKAIRPTRDKAHLFATHSYLTYSEETLKEKLENNPYTFLHIVNPEYKIKILTVCFNTSLLLNDKKFVSDFFKLSS